jgi:hypothetical protein
MQQLGPGTHRTPRQQESDRCAEQHVKLCGNNGSDADNNDKVNIFNYDCNFIRKKKAEGSIDITVYVSVPLTGQDAVMQIYEFNGMPFQVKPGFFVNIE